MSNKRELYFFKNYFEEFYEEQNKKVKTKTLWTLRIIQQLANLAGTNKSYISRLERNLKDIRFSTLQRIINDGLGGYLELSIKLD